MATSIVATDYGSPDVLSVVQSEPREPGPGEVRVQARAIGVNPIDYKLYSGAFGTDPDSLPMPIGQELAGVVTATGEGASGPGGSLAVGDEVIVFGVRGCYTTELTAPAERAFPKPHGLSWEVASGVLLTGATAMHALAKSDVGDGDTLLVHGASGSVGTLLVQLAAAAGVTVIGTASSANQQLLRDLGAVPVTYGDGLADRVRAAAPPGVTAAVDCVGTEEAVEVSLELVADRSRIVTMAALDRTDLGISLIGGAPGADPGAEIRDNAWKTLLPAAAGGTLALGIARSYPLIEASAAHRLVADGHPGGKVVLLP